MGGQLVVVPHTDLTEVTRMVLYVQQTKKTSTKSASSNLIICVMSLGSQAHLVEVGPVVVLTTGQTTTSRMLPVLSDTTVTGRDVSSVLSGVGESGRHSINVSEIPKACQLGGSHVIVCDRRKEKCEREIKVGGQNEKIGSSSLLLLAAICDIRSVHAILRLF